MAFLFVIILIMVTILVTLYYYFAKTSTPIPTTLPQDKDVRDININDIDKMLDGSEFELYLFRLFIELGYSGVYKTVGSRDFGADLVFTDRQGNRNVIQAKRYSPENLVGLSAVQEIYTSMKFYKAKKSMVISSSKYTEACETLAGVNWVKLIDRNDLIRIIDLLKNGHIDQIKDIIESEPRKIYESWKEMQNPYREIKKDKKAEKKLGLK